MVTILRPYFVVGALSAIVALRIAETTWRHDYEFVRSRDWHRTCRPGIEKIMLFYHGLLVVPAADKSDIQK